MVVTEQKLQNRGMVRRQAILDAATELFLDKGYVETSLSDIIRVSKGSRSSVYDMFGSKEGLLRAMVEDVTDEIWHLVHGDDEDSTSLTEDSLVGLARRFLEVALAPRSIAVFRILSGQRHRLPEICEFFFERGPRTVERLLAERFRYADFSFPMGCTPEQLGQIFLGTVLGIFHPHRVLGLQDMVDPEAMDKHVRVAVRIFLDGVRMRPLA